MSGRHEPIVHPNLLRVAHLATSRGGLGPGHRHVVYVQGCALHCQGCVAAEWLDFDGGYDVPVRALADQLLGAGARALTVSGGEPMLQPAALVTLIDLMRENVPDLSVMVYSGYRYERLLARGTAEQLALIARCDLLVDSPYVERWHGDLRWRGSANQRLLRLTDRHTAEELLPDVSAGTELVVGADLRVHQIGVPYRPTPEGAT